VSCHRKPQQLPPAVAQHQNCEQSPIALYPASSLSDNVSFNRINRKTGNRLKQQNVDSETGEVVSREDMVPAPL
jgi:non-homologous end joining protein Ku